MTGLDDRIARKNVREAQPRATPGTSCMTFLLQGLWTRTAWAFGRLCTEAAIVIRPDFRSIIMM